MKNLKPSKKYIGFYLSLSVTGSNKEGGLPQTERTSLVTLLMSYNPIILIWYNLPS